MANEVTQQVLADRLKVSRATVSKSLRGDPSISPATRARVLDLASRLDYRPTPTATAQDDGRPLRVVSVLVADASVADHKMARAWRVLAGLCEASGCRQVQLDIAFVAAGEQDRTLDTGRLPRSLQDRTCQGVVVLGHLPRPIVAELAQDWPCVLVSDEHPGLRVDSVDIDHFEAVNMLFDHFWSLGHRQVGFVGADRNRRQWRLAAFVQSMAIRGLPLDPELILNAPDGSAMSEEQAAGRVAALAQRGVSAWICGQNYTAKALLRSLDQQNVRVPADLSLAGVDGFLAMDDVDGLAELTTMVMPFEAIGAAALDQLEHRLRFPAEPTSKRLLGSWLRQGATTAPPEGSNSKFKMMNSK